MINFLIIILFVFTSILNGGSLKEEENIDFFENNNDFIGDILIDENKENFEQIIETTKEENVFEEMNNQKQEVVVQENITQNESIEQYQEPVYIPEISIVQEQETIQEIEQKQEEIPVMVINPREEALIVQEEQQPEKTEEYKYNEEMTKKMIDMINNNQNENMKQYGYNVVVDSSAKEMSNPFTYTDERILTKIQRRCGTIHVYAEDYYLNGNYFGTDCYIY